MLLTQRLLKKVSEFIASVKWALKYFLLIRFVTAMLMNFVKSFEVVVDSLAPLFSENIFANHEVILEFIYLQELFLYQNGTTQKADSVGKLYVRNLMK